MMQKMYFCSIVLETQIYKVQKIKFQINRKKEKRNLIEKK